tara:strand:- start:24307 stop:24567 length:261 start_codon:yes stop_codon:yes gene_type:complete
MFTVVEKNIWKLEDGTLFEGDLKDAPSGNAALVAKAGREYPEAWLKEQGWGKKEKAPAKKKAAPKKAAESKKVENKAVKPKDTEDK